MNDLNFNYLDTGNEEYTTTGFESGDKGICRNGDDRGYEMGIEGNSYTPNDPRLSVNRTFYPYDPRSPFLTLS